MPRRRLGADSLRSNNPSRQRHAAALRRHRDDAAPPRRRLAPLEQSLTPAPRRGPAAAPRCRAAASAPTRSARPTPHASGTPPHCGGTAMTRRLLGADSLALEQSVLAGPAAALRRYPLRETATGLVRWRSARAGLELSISSGRTSPRHRR